MDELIPAFQQKSMIIQESLQYSSDKNILVQIAIPTINGISQVFVDMKLYKDLEG